jgi:intracellular sulfur oxidation DsrE/DsrF family protein
MELMILTRITMHTPESSNHYNTRRSFITKLAAGAAVLGLAPVLSAYKAETGTLTVTAKSEADEWLDKIKGKHKMVFDAAKAGDGHFLHSVEAFLSTNNETETPDNELGVVIVLRSAGIIMGMNDEMWEKFKLGEMCKVTDPLTKAPSTRNLAWKPKEGDECYPDKSIEKLMKRGVLFGICDKALGGFAEKLAKDMQLKEHEVKKELHNNLLRDIQVVPSGVWALGRAQERGCTYCYAG